MKKRLTCSTEAYFALARSSSPWMSSRTFGSLASAATLVSAIPCSFAHGMTCSSSSVTSITGYGRRSPYMTACETQRVCFMSFSMFAGVRFLPPAVMMMSFFLPVMKT